jgi:hypothetical protein
MDWSGLQVIAQKNLWKLAKQLGQRAIRLAACAMLETKDVIWPGLQHTFVCWYS